MKKTLLLSMLLACLAQASFAQGVSIWTYDTNGSPTNGPLTIPYCTSQTFYAQVTTIPNSPISMECGSPTWYDQYGNILGHGTALRINITSNISVHALAYLGSDCNTTQTYTSNTITLSPAYTATITGPSQVCTLPQSFSVVYLPTNASVSWTASSNLQIVSGQNTPTVQVEQVGTTPGTGTLTATVSSLCSGTMPAITYTTTVGLHTPTAIQGMYTGKLFAPNSEYTFTSTGTDWSVEGGTILSGQGTTSIDVLTANPSAPSFAFNIEVRQNNACGVSDFLQEYGTIVRGTHGGLFVIAPNPAFGTVTLSAAPAYSAPKVISDATERPASASAAPALLPAILQIKIYDAAGRLRKVIDNKAASLPIQVDVSDLSNGVYFLHITTGNTTQQEKLIIQH